MNKTNEVLNKWSVRSTGTHSSELIKVAEDIEDSISKVFTCPRGHTFKTNNPIIIAVDGDSEYNSGPICGYCYVDWFKVNLNANEAQLE